MWLSFLLNNLHVWTKLASGWECLIFWCHMGCQGGGLGSLYPQKSCVPKTLQMHPPCEINGLWRVFRRKKSCHFWGSRCTQTCHFECPKFDVLSDVSYFQSRCGLFVWLGHEWGYIQPPFGLQCGCNMARFVEKFRNKLSIEYFCHLLAFCRFYRSTRTACPIDLRSKELVLNQCGSASFWTTCTFGTNWPLAGSFSFFWCHMGVRGVG